MDVPRTQSGSPCKLCKTKGSVCHMHGGSPRKESMYSMSTQNFLPIDFENFERLPKPAMMNVMLQLSWSQLNYVCRISREANKICKEPRFVEEYKRTHHLNLLMGKLKDSGYDIMTFFGFKDERGNTVMIETSQKGEVMNMVFKFGKYST